MDCSACLGGHYCGVVGQTEPTGLCTAGYYCRRYANTSTPNQGYDGDVCPQGTQVSENLYSTIVNLTIKAWFKVYLVLRCDVQFFVAISMPKGRKQSTSKHYVMG